MPKGLVQPRLDVGDIADVVAWEKRLLIQEMVVAARGFNVPFKMQARKMSTRVPFHFQSGIWLRG